MGDVDNDRDRETDEWLRLEDLRGESGDAVIHQPQMGRDGGESDVR